MVGQPYTALAELVKNAYDADATICQIRLQGNRITVSDNGHGMSTAEFQQHWMTIGTRNKQRITRSRKFGRSTTGSKGVGRLSAQFLAHRMQLVTTSEEDLSRRLHALVDWDTAVEAGLLTNAQAQYKSEPAGSGLYPGGSATGTTVIMEELKQGWAEEDIKLLGRQIWSLQSPFAGWGSRSTGDSDELDFTIGFDTDRPGLDTTFSNQMRAIIDSWHAAIVGSVRSEGDRHFVDVDLRFADGERLHDSWPIEDLRDFDTWPDWFVHEAQWQIRIYDFVGRQPGNVPVQDARDYLQKFGGVTLYDSGFKLPYYGAETDWLGIEFDHSHRKSASTLLPSRLQASRALNDLPTQGRILGVVRINTGAEYAAATSEQRTSGEYLKILITRDRLAGNDAFEQLAQAVRSSIDYYATRQRIRADRMIEIVRPSLPPIARVAGLEDLAQTATIRYPDDEIIRNISSEIIELGTSIAKQSEADDAERSLLGSLASTGMAALALEHENKKEIRLGRQLVRRLKSIAARIDDPEVSGVAGDIDTWLNRLEATRRIFAPMLSQEDRDVVEALQVRSVVEEVIRATEPLMPRVATEIDIPGHVYFPPATFADWHALLQNVLVNAANAMLDIDEPRIAFRFGRTGRSSWLRISNNGLPIDVPSSHTYFEPFRRRQVASSERSALGLGGMGLGLTIVRMIASLRGCQVRFVEDGGPTTFQISWSSGE
nr:ATP-binding protein [Sphingomonas insulae]